MINAIITCFQAITAIMPNVMTITIMIVKNKLLSQDLVP